ncbi:MAG: lipopolysaccharide transport periplasmic protein LptA [Syntrophaceae bacterium]|nr:lipopolysaccharide transport periplasmic protein LptA [Syntrophaceae bacterium]
MGMKKKALLKSIILFTLIFWLLLGCSKKGLKTIEGDPEILYKEGLARFNKRDYDEALKKFELLKASFPDSPPYTIWAELKIGDCHFFKKEYVEAIAAYEEFKKIHPTHDEIPYVHYQIGMAYYNQMLSLDRDQTPTQKALSNFEYLIANYPPSLFTEKAKEKIGICRKRLADHEFYIGHYYYKKGKYKAASARFQGLIEKFPKMPEEDRTLYLLGKSYIEIEQWEKAAEAFRRIVNEYPESPYHDEAKSMLDQGVQEKASSLRAARIKESKKRGGRAGPEPETLHLARFEEERRQPVSFASSPSVTGERAKGISSKGKNENIAIPIAEEPRQEVQTPSTALPPTPETGLKVGTEPEGERSVSALPVPSATNPTAAPEKTETPKSEAPREPAERGEPIDITSDRVETYSRENLIIFKGNVVARQKDMVIYADSLEAVIFEGGKGVEKVIAGGNVKIQQGTRVAHCQRAVFYNIDQRVVLTGSPQVIEGENMVSGDEIVFHVAQNRIEVKGGSSGRGKAKILPGEGVEKLK